MHPLAQLAACGQLGRKHKNTKLFGGKAARRLLREWDEGGGMSGTEIFVSQRAGQHLIFNSVVCEAG